MQEEEEKLKDEVTHMLPQLQPPHPGEKGTERNLAHLALKLIAAEFRRKSGSHSPPGTSSGDGLPSKPAMFKSRFVIDRLIRQLLSTPYFPKILKLSPTEGERILRLRCAIAKGRQIVSFQGSESASILLKDLSIQNHPEAKVVIQAPFDDEAEAGAAFVRPNGSTASSEDLLLYMALSFDVKGLVIEPRSTKTVVVRTNPSSSPIDQATFYTILGGIKEELMESWDSVCVLVVKGGEGCDDKDEMRAKLRALAICMRALHDIKALDRMACCIVKKCTSEQEAQGGLVAIILAECDLRRNNRGLALMPSPTVVENQNRMHVAPIARGGRGGGEDDQRLIREALTKLEGVEDTYKQLVGDLGGYDGFYGRGAAKALKEKFAQLSRQTLL